MAADPSAGSAPASAALQTLFAQLSLAVSAQPAVTPHAVTLALCAFMRLCVYAFMRLCVYAFMRLCVYAFLRFCRVTPVPSEPRRFRFPQLLAAMPGWSGEGQQDAGEFARALLARVDAERSGSDDSKGSESKGYGKNCFEGRMSTRLSCLHCGSRSGSSSSFIDIDLAVPARRDSEVRNFTHTRRSARSIGTHTRTQGCIHSHHTFPFPQVGG